MNEQFIMDVINDLAIPLVMAIVHTHKNATGQVPTLAQIRAVLDADADMGIQVGLAFLQSKGLPTSTPSAPGQ